MKKIKVIAEKEKKPGVTYVVAANGLELPVIDITHPEFYVKPDEEQLRALEKEYLANEKKTAKIPGFLRNIIISLMLKSSIIGRGLLASNGTFLSGMNTYILKLAPGMLGKGYAKNLDRIMVKSLAGMSIRLRLQDMARFMADALAPLLEKNPSAPLHFVNIAGGPSMDSINTLILLNKEKPGTLLGREVKIHILDMDTEGPAFAVDALKALQSDGAALNGLKAEALVTRYDWSDAAALGQYIRANVPEDALTAVSSEGGLFDYCADDILFADMKAIYGATPANTILAGTLTRGDGTGRTMNKTSGALTISRGVEEFSVKAFNTGWAVEKSVARPLSIVMLMVRVTPPGGGTLKVYQPTHRSPE